MLSAQAQDYSFVITLALLSRVLYYVTSYIPTLLYRSYDLSSRLLRSDSVCRHLLSWDAIHFLHIADHGYTYEHAIPFFPLMPFLARVFPLRDNFTSAVCVSNIAFLVSAALMYKVSLCLYTRRFARLSTIFFVFQPSSIIYLSFYSEPLFCMLFLIAFYHILKRRMLKAAIILGIASLSRSNTVMLLIFFKTLYFPIVVLPLALYQFYNLLLLMRLKMSFRIIVPYSYIQDLYWDQGFLRFWRGCNLLNIIFGSFGILYGILIATRYFLSLARAHGWLGARAAGATAASQHGRLDCCSASSDANARSRGAKKNDAAVLLDTGCGIVDRLVNMTKQARIAALSWRSLFATAMDPFSVESTTPTTKLAIILVFQLFTLVLFIHHNIAFRFISFNPLLYWGCSAMAYKHYRSKLFRTMVAVLFTYGMVYAVLFGLFYPPA
ncbi:GPI mannosyltransferase 2 [Pancytospora philotis]|nr:GPI mannosyltransferase 2 [Pancytospora philotis]